MLQPGWNLQALQYIKTSAIKTIENMVSTVRNMTRQTHRNRKQTGNCQEVSQRAGMTACDHGVSLWKWKYFGTNGGLYTTLWTVRKQRLYISEKVSSTMYGGTRQWAWLLRDRGRKSINRSINQSINQVNFITWDFYFNLKPQDMNLV